MKKNLFSILLVVVMTLAMVACGTQETTNDVPVSTETIEATVENSEVIESDEVTSEVETSTEVVEPESSEATSEPEQATEAPVDEVASTPDSEAVESEASEPETSEPEFTVTELNATKYAIQSVNVRSGPSTDFDKIGSLSTNQEITVNGVCDQTGWFRFDLNGTVAFVSNRYVSDSKVEKPAASETPSNGGGSTAGTGSVASSNYETGVWHDMGDYFFYIANTSDEYWGKFNNCDDIRAILQARYPDRNTYVCGTGNERYCIVSALHKNEKGFPNWTEINYIPELGMN